MLAADNELRLLAQAVMRAHRAAETGSARAEWDGRYTLAEEEVTCGTYVNQHLFSGSRCAKTDSMFDIQR